MLIKTKTCRLIQSFLPYQHRRNQVAVLVEGGRCITSSRLFFKFPPQNCISQEALRSAQESVEKPIAPAYPDVATASWLLGTATGVGGEGRKCSCWCCWWVYMNIIWASCEIAAVPPPPFLIPPLAEKGACARWGIQEGNIQIAPGRVS